MSFESLLIHTVTIYNPTDSGESRYGDPLIEWSAGTVVSARVEQLDPGRAREAGEDIVDRDTRRTFFSVFLPSDTNISAISYVEWEGRTFRVVGEPSIVDDAIGPHHIEASIEELIG